MIKGFATERKSHISKPKSLIVLRVLYSEILSVALPVFFFLQKSASLPNLINSYLVVKSSCTNTTMVDWVYVRGVWSTLSFRLLWSYHRGCEVMKHATTVCMTLKTSIHPSWPSARGSSVQQIKILGITEIQILSKLRRCKAKRRQKITFKFVRDVKKEEDKLSLRRQYFFYPSNFSCL